MVEPLVSNYVDAAINQLRRLNLIRFPGKLPEAMRDPSIPPSRDWQGWKPIPSTVTDADLDALEQEIRLQFPPIYRDFLKYLHFVDLTETGVRFERHTITDWREALRAGYFKGWPRERILDVGLIPFGAETYMDAGPACFDTRRRDDDLDCPVVFWDHEWVGTKKEVQPLFSSCSRMFECLTLVASTDLNFIYHDESDDSSLLPRKRELFARFLALDPDGAGGPAKGYWTTWGVAPSGG